MITPQDEAAYHRWLYGSMGLVEAFAMYRKEIENFYIDGGAGEYGISESGTGHVSGE